MQRYDSEKPLGSVRFSNSRKAECVQMDDALSKCMMWWSTTRI